jgi:hypothetical protein
VPCPLSKWRLTLGQWGRVGGREFFKLASKFSNKLSAISIKEDGRLFPSDIRGFPPIGLVGIFFCSPWCKKASCESQKKSLDYWWYFWSSEMHFPVEIKCFRLLFLQWRDVWQIGKAVATFPLSYNADKLLAHLIDIMNRQYHLHPKRLNIHPANLIHLASSRNKLWLRQYIGADMLFQLILLALVKEKPFKNFATLFLFVKTSFIK